MIRLLPFLAALTAAVTLHAQPTADKPPASEPSPPASPESQTRSGVLELAGAFSNDGFKIRDGFWFDTLEPNKPQLLEVNLFSGNEYWFCAASIPPARKLSVQVYDDGGTPLDQESYADGTTAAAGITADYSGKYFIQVTLTEGEKAPFCMIYCYK